jgi:hypothetical protein
MTLTSNATVKAVAFKTGYNPSVVAAASFTNSVTGTSGTGKVYYVAKIGSDSNSCTQAQSQSTPKLTINAGIQCLSSGDTLSIKGGTYAERISTAVTSLHHLSGTSYQNATVIQAYASDQVILRPTCCTGLAIGSGGPGLITQYMIFRNLIIDGTDAGLESGVGIGGGNNGGDVQHIKLEGLEVRNWKMNAMQLGGDDGTGNYLWVTGAKTHDNGSNSGAHCFYVEGSNTLIEYSECYNQQAYGIHNYAVTSAIANPSNNIYRYNYIHNTGQGLGRTAAGLLLTKGSNNQAYGNVIADNQNGVELSASGQIFYNNTVYGNGINQACSTFCHEAILLSASNNTVVKNNIVFDNYMNSIGNNGTASVLTNNLMSDPKFTDAGTGNFRLQSGSPAIDTGTANIVNGITITYNGTAPDIGAYEY